MLSGGDGGLLFREGGLEGAVRVVEAALHAGAGFARGGFLRLGGVDGRFEQLLRPGVLVAHLLELLLEPIDEGSRGILPGEGLGDRRAGFILARGLVLDDEVVALYDVATMGELLLLVLDRLLEIVQVLARRGMGPLRGAHLAHGAHAGADEGADDLRGAWAIFAIGSGGLLPIGDGAAAFAGVRCGFGCAVRLGFVRGFGGRAGVLLEGRGVFCAEGGHGRPGARSTVDDLEAARQRLGVVSDLLVFFAAEEDGDERVGGVVLRPVVGAAVGSILRYGLLVHRAVRLVALRLVGRVLRLVELIDGIVLFVHAHAPIRTAAARGAARVFHVSMLHARDHRRARHCRLPETFRKKGGAASAKCESPYNNPT